MSFNALKTVPNFSDQEVSEFIDYKQNLQEFTTKVSKFQKLLDNFIQETGQENSVPMYRGETSGAVTHDFADGQYIRTIVMPKGLTGVSEIHNKNHPYFIMKGDVTVFSEKGAERIKAPYHGITLAGTQRLLYIHEDCTWVTVHRTDCLTPKEVKAEVLIDSFDDFSLKGFDIKELDKVIKTFKETN